MDDDSFSPGAGPETLRGVARLLVDATLENWGAWGAAPESDLGPAVKLDERRGFVVALHKGLLIDLALRCGDDRLRWPADALFEACMCELLNLQHDEPYDGEKRLMRKVLQWAQAKGKKRPGGKLPVVYLHRGDEDVLSSTLMYELPAQMLMAQMVSALNEAGAVQDCRLTPG